MYDLEVNLLCDHEINLLNRQSAEGLSFQNSEFQNHNLSPEFVNTM